MGFSRQEYESSLPFPSSVDHVLSELPTVSHLSWVALHSMAYSFIELHKLLGQNKALIHEGRYLPYRCIFIFVILYSFMYDTGCEITGELSHNGKICF